MICKLAHEGVLKQAKIGDMFGINQAMVSAIKRGDSWKHATQEFRDTLIK